MVDSFAKLVADWVPGTDPGGTTSFTGGVLVVKKSTETVPRNEPLAHFSCFFVVCGVRFVVGVMVTLALVNLAVVVVTVTGFGCCWVFLLFFVVVFCCFYVVLLFLAGFACFLTPLFPSSTHCLFFVLNPACSSCLLTSCCLPL